MRILCYVNHYFGNASAFVGKSTTSDAHARRKIVQETIDHLRALPGEVDIRVCGFPENALVPIDIDLSTIGEPRFIVYESIERMFEAVDDYDWFINIEDDIFVRDDLIANAQAFTQNSEINEIWLPNRVEERADGTWSCVDLEAMPGWVGLERQYHNKRLGVALNCHSGIFLLNRDQMRYASARVDLRRREEFHGGLMASAYANLHAPFLVWRSKSNPLDHCVVHADNWLFSAETQSNTATPHQATADEELHASQNVYIDTDDTSNDIEESELRNEIRRLTDQLNETIVAHEALLYSTSWRVTAPLRRFGVLFPYLKTPLRRVAQLVLWTVTFQLIGRLKARQAITTVNKEESRLPACETPKDISKAKEGSIGFDRAWYLSAYPDIAASGKDPFQHWLDLGKAEGRHINAHFSFSPHELAVLAKSYHYKTANDDVPPHQPSAQAADIFDSARYWSARYQSGGSSGAGSYGRLAHFKAEIINDFVREKHISSVIELGCGDGSQLELANYPNYLGFDVANESIDICHAKFQHDKTKDFRNTSAWDYERAELVLSLDVIYHLVEDAVFHEYMQRLFASSEKFVIIYSSNHVDEHPASHVEHRRFTDWIDVYHADFKLIQHIPNAYPLVSDDKNESFADFYIFEKHQQRNHTLPGHLVVSLTSYTPRFPTLELTLQRILQQSIKPDETVLWVSPEDRVRLPDGVLALQRSGLTIREAISYRSYTKIIPALEAYPDSFIITMDDDLAYPLDTIEHLINSYREPSEILCRRAHKITYDAAGKPLPYNQWEFETAEHDSPNLFPTGTAGILYPPRTLSSEVLAESIFTSLAPLADDVWLFWMGRLAGSTVRRVGPRYALQPWPGCHEQGLWVAHNEHGGNDHVIKTLIDHYGWPIRQHSNSRKKTDQ